MTPKSSPWLERKQRAALQRAVEQQLQLAAARPARRRSVWRVRDAALLTLMLNTGLRVGEVAGLDLAAVELKPRGGKITVRGNGTKVRAIPLNIEARDRLAQWLAVRPQGDSPAVFISQFLVRMTTRTVERVVGAYGQLAQVDNLTPLQLRHTFAKALAERGVPLEQVAALLGQANLNALRLYTPPTERALAQAVEALID